MTEEFYTEDITSAPMYNPHYVLIVNEMLIQEPLTPTLPSKPYQNDDDYEIKVHRTYQAVKRSIKLKNRQKSLIYAYYLGELIEGIFITKSQRVEAKGIISCHYFNIAMRMFHLFETDPSQILRTTTMTLNNVRLIPHPDYRRLISEEVFPGGSN